MIIRKTGGHFLYQLRPLVRYKYLTRRSDGFYSILEKGRRQLAEEVIPLISCGGDAASRKRAVKIARVAGFFYQMGIASCSCIPEEGFPAFVPSPVWRNIREGIVSTSAFLGMLFYDGLRLAVYDIGDGAGPWQTYAERSLHFYNYGAKNTRATGILMICDNGQGIRIGREIIRQTLWRRKSLLKGPNEYSWEDPRKRPYSKAPIRLHSDYQQVVLAEWDDLPLILATAAAQERIKQFYCQTFDLTENNNWQGRFLENGHERVYVNLHNDILYLATILKKRKEYQGHTCAYRNLYIASEKYKDLASMYPDLDLRVVSLDEEEIVWRIE